MKRGNDALIFSIGEDLLQNILSRLPAIYYTRAVSTCRTFYSIGRRILNRPKILTALSLKPNLQDAATEALEKALSEPIQPHFAVACIGRKFSLKKAHELIKARLGNGIPIITSVSRGLIGKEVVTGEFKEVNWNENESDEDPQAYNSLKNVNRGILLILGFVPGLKVTAIPLIKAKERSEREHMVDVFLSNIKSYTTSMSDSAFPIGIVLFADRNSDMRFVLEKTDYGLGGETIIVGDERGCFLFCREDDPWVTCGSKGDMFDAVGLVFAKDRDKSHDIGEIHFSLALSTGVSPVGPSYKAASVRVSKDTVEYCTWLTATREGSLERLDGQRILADIENEMENNNYNGEFYIGVSKRRKCADKPGKGKLVSSFAFHEILGGDEEYLFVDGEGIRTGDPMRCYFPDKEAALASLSNVFEILKLKASGTQSSDLGRQAHDGKQVEEIFGGLMFTCCGRGESFFGNPNVDSSPFLANFPNAPLAGMFCAGEIGCGPSIKLKGGKELNYSHSYLHVYSTLYLVMSYSPKCQQNETAV